MPKIISNSKKPENQERVAFERTKFLSKDDLKSTFAYGLVTVTVSFALWGMLKSYYNQITK